MKTTVLPCTNKDTYMEAASVFPGQKRTNKNRSQAHAPLHSGENKAPSWAGELTTRQAVHENVYQYGTQGPT